MIVPVYNSSHALLERCLDSILAQWHRTLEVLVVDDGSDGAYGRWLDGLGDCDDRVRVLHQENLGVSEARNTGMRASRGKYLCFVDSDDRVAPEFVATGLDLLRRTESDAAFGGILIPLDDRVTRWRYGPQDSDSPVVLDRNAFGPLRAQALSASPTPEDQTALTVLTNVVATIYRRRAVRDLTFRPGVTHAEDRLFLVDFLGRAERIALCSDVWYIYDQSSASATRDLGWEAAQKLPATIRALADAGGFSMGGREAAPKELSEAAATGILNYFKVLAGVLADHADRPAAVTLLRAVLADPAVREALWHASARSVVDWVFLAALRQRRESLVYLMAKAWRLRERKRATPVSPSRVAAEQARRAATEGDVPITERALHETPGDRPVVGLIVHFSTTNYGNHLVNYATRRLLEKCGYEVELIDFHGRSRYRVVEEIRRLPRKLYRLGLQGLASRLTGRLARTIRRVRTPSEQPTVNTERHLRFAEFSDRYLRPRAVEASARLELLGQFDRFAVGSDQIWNYDYGLEPWHFADFADAHRVVTLSPSVGHEEIPLEWSRFYAGQLARFDEVGVREVEWAESLSTFSTLPRITLLVDPTLTLTREEWADIAVPAPVARGKILVYMLGDILPDQERYISDLCARHDVESILLSERIQGPQWETNAAGFLGMIAESIAVVTDSYHGAVFAFLFDKPLIIIHRHGFAGAMNSRIETLASRCHLTDRAMTRLEVENALQHDYSSGFEALKHLRDDFWNYMGRHGYSRDAAERVVPSS